MKKYIFTALTLGLAASAANAEALTVVHKEAGAFQAELDAAIAEAQLSGYAQVTDLTIISEATTDENENVSYAYMVNDDFIAIRTYLRPSLQRINMAQVKFNNDATPGGQWDSNTILNKMTSLTEAILPEGLRSLNGGAFTGCTALKTVVLPSTLRVIGSYCFQDCKQLELAELPESITTIGASAFMNDEKIATASLPQSVVRIEADAFNGTKVAFDVLPEGITYIGNKAFRGTNVSFSTLPSSLTKLGAHNTNEYFGTAVFVMCDGITDFTIPEVLWAEIPNQTFWVSDASASRTFTCRSLTAPAAAVNATNYTGVFGNAEAFPNYTLRVLKDAEEAYKAKAPWSTMKIEALTTAVTVEFAENVSVEHPHHGTLAPGANDIYEGTHEWTITPAQGRYIKSVSLAPDGDIALYAEDAEENELFAADPSTDTAELDGQAVKVSVPVGANPLYLTIVDDAARQSTVGIDAIGTEATITRTGNVISVSEGSAELFDLSGKAVASGAKIDLSTLARGVYILRAAGTTQKIAI